MTGIRTEHSIEAALNALGAKTVRTDELDHQYKIDFVVTHFEGVPRFLPIGVQVTTVRDNRSKMNEFVAKQRGVVSRAVYLEIVGVEEEPWVGAVVYAALLVHANLKDAPAVMGLRVSCEGVEWFQVTTAKAVRGELLHGTLQRIHAKGYGFILAKTGETFFYHATDIDDPTLRDTLERLQKVSAPWSDVDVEVTFANNGYEREGATQQSARNVTRYLPAVEVVEGG